MEKQLVVIDSTAGATDATLANRILQIKGCPPINFLDLVSVGQGWMPSLVETSDYVLVSFTAAASTEYALNVSQWIPGLQRHETDVVPYTSDSTGTNTVIRDGMIDYINRKTTAGQWHLTATAVSSTSFSIVGTTGYPMFVIGALRNTTVTQGITAIAPHATAGTALAGTTTVTVTTAAAHGLVAGQVVTIGTATGFTFTRNGVATVAGITNAVIATVPTTVTFTLEQVTGSGTNTGAIVITPQAQYARGTYADLISQGVSSAVATVGATYSVVHFEFYQTVNPLLNNKQQDKCTLRLFVKDGITNLAAFKAALILHFQALAGGVSNPEALAVRNE